MTKRLNIHTIVKFFYPVAAGIETNMMETYSPQVKNGWNVYVHTSADTHIEKNVLVDKETVRDIKIQRYPFGRFSYWPRINWNTADIVALHNFDVLPHVFVMLMTGIKKILGTKKYVLVLTPHGGYNPEWRVFNPIVSLPKRLYHYTIGTLLVNWTVDGVRAVSEWEKREMIKKGISANKIITIANGVEDDAYEPVEKLASAEIKKIVAGWGDYIINMGRVYPIKNYETVIHALARVPKSVKYVIVGPISSTSYKEKLDKLIKELDLTDRVVFAGVIRGIDKYYVVKKAKLMVHMALWESFCNVVHEGMSQGLPIIAANNTALPLLVKDDVNGYCIETKDDREVARKINYILQNYDSEKIQNMKKLNQEYGLEESWKSVSTKMKNWYKSLIK